MTKASERFEPAPQDQSFLRLRYLPSSRRYQIETLVVRDGAIVHRAPAGAPTSRREAELAALRAIASADPEL